MYLLEMNHVKKSFDGQGVLKDISLSVEEGEIVSIIGPSGSGKSTLLRCATMLEKMDSGELLYLEGGMERPRWNGRLCRKRKIKGDPGKLRTRFPEFQLISPLQCAEKHH